MTHRLFRRAMFGAPPACLFAATLGAQQSRGGSASGQRPASIPPIPPVRRDFPADRERNLKDLAQLAGVVQELRDLVEKTNPEVVSVLLLKKADEMRSLAEKVRGRLRSDYK
jgi:hypothetical protein